MMKKFNKVMVILLAIMLTVGLSMSSSALTMDVSDGDFVLGQAIVVLEEDLAAPNSYPDSIESSSIESSIESLFPEINLLSAEVLMSPLAAEDIQPGSYSQAAGGQIVLLEFDSSQSVLDVVGLLQQNPNVKIAEPNYIAGPCAIPNDPDYSQQWGMQNIQANLAWDIETGKSTIRVGVLDSGIQLNHPDLISNLDSTLKYNAVDGSGNVNDQKGHGTHVAGIIGAKGNNGIGVTGVCWNISLVPIKISNDPVGATAWSSDLIKGIDYAKNNGIEILNNSYSFWEGYDPSIEYAVNLFPGIVVGGSGNDAADRDRRTAYNCNNLILVGNIDSSNMKYSTSTYGKNTVHLFAPGTGIYSTRYSSYNLGTGASMSAPHVAGVAALLKSYNPNLTTQEIKDAILNNVDEIPALAQYCITGGKLNAYKALMAVTQPVANPYTLHFDYLYPNNVFYGDGYYMIDAYNSGNTVEIRAYAKNSQGVIVTPPELFSMVYTTSTGVSNTNGIFTVEELEINPDEEVYITATATFSDGMILQDTARVYAPFIDPSLNSTPALTDMREGAIQ